MSRDRRYRNKDTLAADVSIAIAESNADSGIGIELNPVLAEDAVHEWWIQPLATSLDSPYPRIVHGAISSTGEILVCEYNIATKKTLRIVSGVSIVDDHACPAIWAEEGRRFLLGWCDHGSDIKVKFKCSTPNGDIRSFASAPEFTFYNGAGEGATYTQIVKINHLCTANLDVFWVFSRRTNLLWQVIPVTVEQDSGLISFGAHKIIFSAADDQCYISIADAHVASPGNQKIRIAWGYNPATTKHAIFGFEIDCVTGAIANVVDDTFTANIDGTNLPISDATPPVAFVAEPAALNSRRLHYVRPGPDSFAAGYADFLVADPNNATYRVKELPKSATGRGLIKTSNASVGYATAAYRAAMQTNTMEYIAFFRLTNIPTADVELGRRANDSADGAWWFRIKTNRKVLVRLLYPSGQMTEFTSATAVPGDWNTTVGLRLVVDDTLTPKVAISYSTDGGDNWTLLDSTSPAGLSAGFRVTASPLVVPAYLIANQTTYLELHSISFKTGTGGTLIAGVDFTSDWTQGATTYTDAATSVWTLVGPVYVDGAQVATITDYGVSGARVGYTAAANYIAGMCFDDPSDSRVVYTAHTDGTTETIKMHIPEYGTEETLVSASTTQGRLIRPYAPKNGGTFNVIYTEMEYYSPTTYTVYKGKVKAI